MMSMEQHDDAPADASLLDAQTVELLEMMKRTPFLDLNMTPPQMRRAFDDFYARSGFPISHVARIENHSIAGPGGPIALRSYHPQVESREPLPLLLFYHGGGMMMGSLNAYDPVCRRLAAKAEAIVVSASYRLAPEHKFPAAHEDAECALRWVAANAAALGGDPQRLAISGESGGGNLAAASALRARDTGGPPIAYQILINPAVGTRGGGSRSMKKYARGFFFEAEALDWFVDQYLPPAARNDGWASPILAKDFSKLPPTFIVVAGFDILRDDIEDYARLLRAAGVSVQCSYYESTIHGFTVMGGVIGAGLVALDECAVMLRKHLATRPGGRTA